MRGRLFGLLLAAAVIVPASAKATPVLVMGRHGQVSERNDPFLTASSVTPAPFAVAPTPLIGLYDYARVSGGERSSSPAGSRPTCTPAPTSPTA